MSIIGAIDMKLIKLNQSPKNNIINQATVQKYGLFPFSATTDLLFCRYEPAMRNKSR